MDCPPDALETPSTDPDGCPICGVWETGTFGPVRNCFIEIIIMLTIKQLSSYPLLVHIPYSTKVWGE